MRQKTEYDMKEIVEAIRKIIKKNENFNLSSLDNDFSRNKESFFPLLSIEIN
jgi:hypothetical protein